MSKYLKMKGLIAKMQLPDYRYKQLLDAIFRQRIEHFKDMTLLPKSLRQALEDNFGETVIGIKAIHHERSAQTDKVLFELPNGNGGAVLQRGVEFLLHFIAKRMLLRMQILCDRNFGTQLQYDGG